MTPSGTSMGEGARRGTSRHVPVLLPEVLRALRPQRGATYIDGTFGAGGYSAAILAAAPGARVLAIDRDPEAIAAGARLATAQQGRLLLLDRRLMLPEPLDRAQVFDPEQFRSLDLPFQIGELLLQRVALGADAGFQRVVATLGEGDGILFLLRKLRERPIKKQRRRVNEFGLTDDTGLVAAARHSARHGRAV